jgi:hypothetical protein
MAYKILPLVPLLREHIQTIKQKTDQAYAGLAGLLSLRDRNLILAQLGILRAGFLAIGEQSGDAITEIDRVLQQYEGENGGEK